MIPLSRDIFWDGYLTVKSSHRSNLAVNGCSIQINKASGCPYLSPLTAVNNEAHFSVSPADHCVYPCSNTHILLHRPGQKYVCFTAFVRYILRLVTLWTLRCTSCTGAYYAFATWFIHLTWAKRIIDCHYTEDWGHLESTDCVWLWLNKRSGQVDDHILIINWVDDSIALFKVMKQTPDWPLGIPRAVQ